MVWKRSHGSSNIHRIKTSFRHFSNYKIPIHIKYSPIHAIKLWKLLVAVVVISLTIHSVNEQNRRIQPQRNIDYSLLSQADTFDEKFTDRLLKKCPISHRSFKSNVDDVFQYGCRDPLKEAEKPRANAAFVVLARNSEIDGVILSMRSLERRFNQWFNYPWVFLNDEEFTEEFKTRVEEVASGDFKFGVIPKSKWKFEQQQESESSSRFFNEVVENQGDRGIMYGNMPSYHSMCRFYSGFFFEHPLVQSLDWYWRVEPEVDFYCDLTYDPFIEMEKHGKKYGYTIAIKELIDTVPNLFRYTKQFILENNIELPDTWNFFSTNYKFFKGKNSNDYSDVKNLNDFWAKLKKNTLFNYSKLHLLNNAPLRLNKRDKEFLQNLVKHSKPYGLNSSVNEKYDNENFNMCHFWSNFEIASNELFTSPAYKAYYEFLEKSNGFFTERWGDAPIHSLAAGMFLTLDEIHYFRDIGYKHSTIGHCPFNSPNQLPYKAGPKFKHQVLPEDEIYYADYDKPVTDDVLSQNLGASGCRCRCPSDHIEIENSGGSCSALWLKLTDDEYNNAKSNNDDNNNSNNRSQNKGKNKNNKDAGSDVFVEGLGDFNFLDLDKIEPLALQYLQEWIDSGKNLKDWDLTDDQIKVLSILYRKDEISLID